MAGRVASIAGLGSLVCCGARSMLFDSAVGDQDGVAAGSPPTGPPHQSGLSPAPGVAHDGAPVDGTSDAGFDAPSDASASVDAAPIPCAATSEPTELASLGNVAVDQIMLDDSYIYFHDNTGVSRVAKSGGRATSLASFRAPSWPDLSAFALDSTGITWWEILNGKTKTDVKHVSKQGGAVVTLTTLGDYFFYGSGGPAGSIYAWSASALDQVATNGGVTQIPTGAPTYVTSLADDDGIVYLTAGSTLYRWSGAAFQPLASAPGLYLDIMAFDANTIFVASGSEGGFVVSALPKTGTSFTTLLTVPTSYLGGIAVDGDHVWVVDRISGIGNNFIHAPSMLLRMAKDGSDLTTFATNPSSQIVGVAVDDLCVYWTETEGNGSLPSRVVAARK
jgi:hypothetical protein